MTNVLDGIPQMAVFAYKAINDASTSIQTTDEHMDRLCRVGANVLYERNTVGSHSDEYFSGGRRALEWLSHALDGQQLAPRSGCKVRNVTLGMPE